MASANITMMVHLMLALASEPMKMVCRFRSECLFLWVR